MKKLMMVFRKDLYLKVVLLILNFRLDKLILFKKILISGLIKLFVNDLIMVVKVDLIIILMVKLIMLLWVINFLNFLIM